MVALRAALNAAGVESSDDQLVALSREAVQCHPGDFDAAVAALFRAILDKPAIVDLVFRPFAAKALRDHLRSAAGVSGRAGDANRPGFARPPAVAPRGSAALAAVSNIVRAAYLARMTILGKPLGQCTKAELESLAQASRHEAWLYNALAHPMPPGGATVADIYSDDDIADIDRRWNGEVVR